MLASLAVVVAVATARVWKILKHQGKMIDHVLVVRFQQTSIFPPYPP